MPYQLGVDLGTTFTAAAVLRGDRAEICTLGDSNPVMPSIVTLREDGELLVGEIALRRGQIDPTRMAREFKRRLGDPAPLVLGSTPYSPDALMGCLLRSIVDTVTEREGERPSRVVLTHPASYGPYKLEMMREVARAGGVDLSTLVLLTEPQAAAISYSARDRLETGEHVAVYDLGGGTFDAAVLRKTADGFALVGQPEGLDRFGGIDIDAAVLTHIDIELDGALSAVDQNDPDVQFALQRLRDDCRAAKETLSGDSDTSIQVSLPGIQRRVRLTRVEIESMVRPRLKDTIDALRRTIASAGIEVDDVSRVLMVGGSSRIPLAPDMVARSLGRPVAVDAHPKLSIALGAAAFRGATAVPVAPAPVVPVAPAPQRFAPPPTPAAPTRPVPATPIPATPRPVVAPAAPPAPPRTADPPPRSGGGRRRALMAAVGVVVVSAVVIGVIVSRSGGEDESTDSKEPATTNAPTPDTEAVDVPGGDLVATATSALAAVVDTSGVGGVGSTASGNFCPFDMPTAVAAVPAELATAVPAVAGTNIVASVTRVTPEITVLTCASTQGNLTRQVAVESWSSGDRSAEDDVRKRFTGRTVQIDESVPFGDGEILTYCVVTGPNSEARFCAATWSQDGLVVGVTGRQLSASNLSRWLRLMLGGLIDDLASS